MNSFLRYVLHVFLLFSLVVIARFDPVVAKSPYTSENLFYMVDSEDSFQSFREHVEHISVVAPQTFYHEDSGVIWGDLDSRVRALVAEHNIRVVPLVLNAGFNQQEFHRFLQDQSVQARAIAQLIEIGNKFEVDGWQFDYENIHIDDRDAFTEYYRRTAKALHNAGMEISIAVVPRDGNYAGPTSYHKYIHEYWRGGYDLKALAEIGDYISLMTYSQHTRFTTPGPVAGYSWVESLVQFSLEQEIPADKLSLGIPFYSYHWYPRYTENGGRVWASGLSFEEVAGLLERYQAEITWLPDQKVHTAFWDNDGLFEYVFIEDQRSLDAKLDLLEKYELRGISVWRLGQEDPAMWNVIENRLSTVK